MRYPEECPVFEIMTGYRDCPSFETGQVLVGWTNHGALFLALDTDNGQMHDHQGGALFFSPGDVRPLTRAAREMLDLVTP